VILPPNAHRSGKQKNFYSAKLLVGSPPQEFQVAFDLQGGTTFFPSESCADPACLERTRYDKCLERHRYDKWDSRTAEDIQADGSLVEPGKPKTLLSRRNRGRIGVDSIDIGSGNVDGTFIRDQICVLGDATDSERWCFPMSMLAATNMSDMPFLIEPYDGTVGLSLEGMSVSKGFNFLASYRQGPFLPGFSGFALRLGMDSDGGEISFGGYDVNALAHPLQWTSVVAPEEGRWQVLVSAIRVGNATLEACRERPCRAVLDYSSSLLSAPTSLVNNLEASLAGFAGPEGFGDGCQYVSIPEISLDLANNLTITLPAEDYVSEFGSKEALISKPSCEPRLGHHDDDELLGEHVFILGEATLRRYFTVFDVDSLRVGFSLASSEFAKEGEVARAIAGGNAEPRKDETTKATASGNGPIILLVQVKVQKSKTFS
jgi:hypothetical protein